MKRKDKSIASIKSIDQLISRLTENQILSTKSMSFVKGGETEGEAGGGNTQVIVPPR